MAYRFGISYQTVSKCRNINFTKDASSCQNNNKYALSELKIALIISIRKSSWLPLDEFHETILAHNSAISRSSAYRCLTSNKINKVPEEQKDKAQKFKAYQSGYLNIDVTSLPKFRGKNAYFLLQLIEPPS